MKIEYRNGDLFQTDIKTIVHGCNAQGVMGSGIAKIIREKYPSAYERYRDQYLIENKLVMGSLMVVPCDDKIIVNAITQEFFGRDSNTIYVSYWAIAEAFRKIEMYNFKEIALPKIGAGLARGDWNVISAIIENTLVNTKPVVYYID